LTTALLETTAGNNAVQRISPRRGQSNSNTVIRMIPVNRIQNPNCDPDRSLKFMFLLKSFLSPKQSTRKNFIEMRPQRCEL